MMLTSCSWPPSCRSRVTHCRAASKVVGIGPACCHRAPTSGSARRISHRSRTPRPHLICSRVRSEGQPGRRCFALGGIGHASHKKRGSMIRRFIP